MTALTLRRSVIATLISLALVSAWGCSSPTRISYIPEGGSYTANDLTGILDATDLDKTASIPVDDIDETRQEALADLRTHGDDAAALADTLTHQFPVDVNAVPIEARAVTYEGQPAWIVVESWGEAGEQLSSARLWVFSAEDHSLITAASGQ
ncbi:MAG: hypothetical protein RBS17_09730 [Coriobacteriia bacterium]|nr:hypothetical protein [Coriobacteriia bacterium]